MDWVSWQMLIVVASPEEVLPSTKLAASSARAAFAGFLNIVDRVAESLELMSVFDLEISTKVIIEGIQGFLKTDL